MILEAVVSLLVPAVATGLYKAVRVEKEVETQKEDIIYIRSRVDDILDHLLGLKKP